MAAALAMTIMFSVLVQGGYFPTVFLICAVVITCMLIFRKGGRCSTCGWPLWGLAAWYLFTSLIRGYRADSLGQACLPVVCALFLTTYDSLDVAQKRRVLDYLIWGNWFFAGIAILAFCGILPLAGAVTAHRLQSTFQYANAAGSWFAAMALLTLGSIEQKNRRLALPGIVALFLTRSVGALGLYILLQLVQVFIKRKQHVWKETVLIHSLAALFSVALFFTTGWTTLPIILLLYLAGWHLDKLIAIAGRIYLQWACLAMGGVGMVAVLYSRRAASSLATFAERIVQIHDGLAVITAHPIFGVGAGNWAEVYPYYQSAQYVSSVIHSGIIQIGVDAGVPAMSFTVAFFLLALRGKGRSLSEILAVMLLAVHSLMDFTMQFFPIAALFLAVLFLCDEPKPLPQKTINLIIIPVVCAGLLCAGLFWEEMQYKRLVRLGQEQAWTEAASCYSENQFLFGDSLAARVVCVRSLYQVGKLQDVLSLTSDPNLKDMELFLLRAQALQRLDDQDTAVQLLLSQLERQPYRIGLYEQSAELLLQWEAGEEQCAVYNSLVDRANERGSILGDLMGNQIQIEHIKTMGGISHEEEINKGRIDVSGVFAGILDAAQPSGRVSGGGSGRSVYLAL